MASRFLWRSLQFKFARFVGSPHPWNISSSLGRTKTYPRWAGLLVLSGACYIGLKRWKRSLPVLPAVSAKEEDGGKSEVRKPSKKERRFKEFASCSYKGVLYMTARDFLECVTQSQPRVFTMNYLDDAAVVKMLNATPPRRKGSSHLFRDLWENGLISYGNYLFLLSILTKPTSQFEVTFKIIDRDGSNTIDREEFLYMGATVTKENGNAQHQQGWLKETSLERHFFGTRGREKLYLNDFIQFIENLQNECRQIEFTLHAKGLPTITELEFAAILLKHTSTRLQEVTKRLQKKQSLSDKGINFDNFNMFCHLLNNLEDFSTALSIHTLSGQPITQDEFKRAAYICIGKELDGKVIKAVFDIFDVDGDGKLSYKEFIHVMRNWNKRASLLQEARKIGIWRQFKTCVYHGITEN